MSKVLFITNIANKIGSFSIASINAAQSTNMRFHMAAYWDLAKEDMDILQDGFNVQLHHVDLVRSPYAFRNYKAFRQLVKIIRDENIDYIHCNTPTGGILGRLVGKKCGVKKVFYQAHGFHFYKGAPKKNWLLYYPVEKWLAHYTDVLITINQEDYELAKNNLKLRKGGRVYYVPGVGIDLSAYNEVSFSKREKRTQLGLKDGDIFIISTGDLIKRKNYATALKALQKANDARLHYFICGDGPEKENLQALTMQLGLSDQVHFLGYRTDIIELLLAADMFLFTTKQEGLSRSLMEAMATGLPCVVSEIRGNVDLIEDQKGGHLCPPTDITAFANAIKSLADTPELCLTMKQNNLRRIKEYDISVIEKKLTDIYLKELHD